MNLLDKCYIDGRWINVTGNVTFDHLNPATEQLLSSVKMASAHDANLAVQAARRAFASFSLSSKLERIELLSEIAAKFAAREAELTDIVARELGSPISSTVHTAGTLSVIKQAIETLRNYEFESSQGSYILRREPIGVGALITAWNWPLQLLGTKVSAALAAGCTVVLKPSEFTPQSAIAFTEILHDAGTPAGVFNMVIGDGPTVGGTLSAHPDVDIVSFTGSTRAGIQVALAAAPSVKRVSQELGGKSANIVLPDADLKQAIQWNVSRAFFNTGQSCHAPTRLLVHESQLASALDLLRAEVAKVHVGDPFDPATTMGPLINQAQFERVQAFIQKGIDEGAQLVCGGMGRPASLYQGYFVKPTVFANVDPQMVIAQEEIFGPVLVVISYSSLDQALAIANGTPYGLGGYVFTNDREQGLDVCRRLRAGRVFLNGMPSNPAAPMGGFKQSGNGREMGVFGLEEYLEVKAMIGF